MKHAWTVFRKEALEMRRDKRALNAVLIVPPVLIALMVFGFGALEGGFATFDDFAPEAVESVEDGETPAPEPAPSRARSLRVGVSGPVPDSFDEFFQAATGLETVPFNDTVTMRESIRSQGVNVGAIFTASDDDGPTEVLVLFNPEVASSLSAVTVVSALADQLNREAVEITLQEAGINPDTIQPFRVERQSVTEGEDEENFLGTMLVNMLPYFVILWAFVGAVAIAADMVTGEKEKLTIESLLSSPITRKSAALGKFLALTALGMAAGLMTILGMVVGTALPLAAVRTVFPEGLQTSFVGMLSMVAVLLPLVMAFSGVLLIVSSLAKTIREAQSYLGYASTIVVLPAVMSQFVTLMGVENATWVRWTPILNSAVCMKQALQGRLQAEPVLIAVGLNLLIALVMLALTFKVFERESMLGKS